jgi:hypothetical protein
VIAYDATTNNTYRRHANGVCKVGYPPKKSKSQKGKQSTGTDTWKRYRRKDDGVIDKETDDKQSDEMDEIVENIDEEHTEADIKVREKDDDVIDKETDDKQSDEMDEDDKKKIGEEKALLIEESKADEENIDEKAAAEMKIDETTEMKIDEKESVDKVFSDKKTDGEGAVEELDTADANEAQSTGKAA